MVLGLVLVFTLPYSSGPAALEASTNCNMQHSINYTWYS